MDGEAKKGRGNRGGWAGVNSVSFESDFQFDGLPVHGPDDSSERLANRGSNRPSVTVFRLNKAFLVRYP